MVDVEILEITAVWLQFPDPPFGQQSKLTV
jgi:hypothetical protein